MNLNVNRQEMKKVGGHDLTTCSLNNDLQLSSTGVVEPPGKMGKMGSVLDLTLSGCQRLIEKCEVKTPVSLLDRASPR
jgi:hypothetical protein